MKTILLLLLASLTFSRLLTPRSFDNLKIYKDDGVKAGDLKTTCTNPKPTEDFDKTQQIFSGYLNIKQGSSSVLAFIFYGSKKATSASQLQKYPTIIWLNGGPGSSSQLGNFEELGPLVYSDKDGERYQNEYTWINEYNVMFLDQPIGAGFSYSESDADIPKNQDDVQDHFYYAMQQFFQSENGCVQKFTLTGLDKSKFFIFGESYGGKYAPAFAEKILKMKGQEGALSIQLKGIGIGDGFTDPNVIMQEMPSMAYNLGLIDYKERQKAERDALKGAINIAKGNYVEAKKNYYQVMDYISEQDGGMNVYDIYKDHYYETADAAVIAYLNNPDTKAWLGFTTDFKIQNPELFEKMSDDFMRIECIQRLEYVLQQKLPVVIYSGQYDLIVPTAASVRWAHHLNYDGKEDFYNQAFKEWKLNDEVVGYYKKVKNLELRVLNKAGHLVPMDQPAVALDLITKFVTENQ